MPFSSIRINILVRMLGIVLLFGVMTLVLVSSVMARMLRDEVEKREVYIAQQTANESAALILTEDSLALQLLLGKKLVEKDVIYAFITDEDHNVLAHTFGESFPVALKDANRAEGKPYHFRKLRTNEGMIFDVAAPIVEGKLGEVRIGISERGIKRSVDRVITVLVLAIAGICVFVSWMSIIFSGAVVRPISELVKGVKNLSAGNLAFRVRVESKDEIGVLARAFNAAMEELGKITVSRDDLIEEVAERKRAEEDLARLGQKNEFILKSVAEGILGLDLEGTHTFVNPTAAKMLGYEVEELLGRPSHSLWHHTRSDGNPCSQEECQIRAVCRDGAVHRVADDIFWRKDGTSFSVEYTSTPIHEQGRFTGVVLVFSDITERKNKQTHMEHDRDIQRVIGQLLKLSLEDSSLEDYLGQALDLILGVSWFSLEARGSIFLVGEDPNTLVMAVQQGLSDYVRKACRILPFGKCHCGKAAETKKTEFASTVTGRHEIHYEGMVPHGHYCVPILLGEKVVGVLNAYVRENYKNDEATKKFLEIIANALAGGIERKKTEDALRKAHEGLEVRIQERTAELVTAQEYNLKILATITDYIYTVRVENGAAVETLHRPACFAVTGYTAEEFKAQPDLWENTVYEEDREKVREFSVALLAGKNIQPLEHRIRRKDGAVRWVRSTPVLHFDPSGQLMSYDGIISDISDWKHAEILMMESMKRVDRANKAKSQFLANMSHEFRTPLNAIIGFSDLLKNTNLEPIQKEYVGMLHDGGEILLSLVTSVLDFSKMEAGEVRLEKVNFNLEHLIQSVIRINRAKLKEKELRIFSTIDKKVPLGFRGDPTRIKQVLMNLLDNAVKFTEKGEVEVRVTLAREREKQDLESEFMIKIAVRDTGIGIPWDKRETIFSAFEQADISTTRKYGGTGLGLSISKGLVALMGGTIELESEPGKGSTFSLVLPLEVAPLMEEMQTSSPKDMELDGKKILILDDEESAREIFTHYCEEAGMVVSYAASSAQDALKWLSEQSSLPDIFLVDILMPELSGYEMAEKIRKDKKYDHVRLVAVTGDTRSGSAFKAQQSGFDAYLTKPTLREELVKAIKTVIGDQREKIKPGEVGIQPVMEESVCRGMNILVVEDNPASRELLSIILNNFGFQVETAFDGREAVEKVKTNSYDLILMDLQMPIMGGCEATQIIRTQLQKTTPILALTAGVSGDDKEKCLAAGMNDYLMKPIEIPVLKDKIARWTQGIS